MIARDVIAVMESGRCPLLLTGRKEHLDYFESKLAGCAKHIFVLKGGTGKKQRRTLAAALTAVPETDWRIWSSDSRMTDPQPPFRLPEGPPRRARHQRQTPRKTPPADSVGL
jgi:hypothetical protein